jgi:Protein of unknown function (DUF3667)
LCRILEARGGGGNGGACLHRQFRRRLPQRLEARVPDTIDTLGNLVNAGLFARALEPDGGINHAEVADTHHVCANCDAPLAGNFCANCGQKAHVHRSLLHVGEEFLHGITHFDGKAWQTLPLLVFRPGKLTRDYIEGRRARYIAPVPLFLLVVFLMFFVFSYVNVTPGSGGASAINNQGLPMTQAEASKELPRLDAELADLDNQIAAARASGESMALPGLLGARTGVAAARDTVTARARGEVNSVIGIPGAIAEEIGAANDKGELTVNLGNATLNEKARRAIKNPQLVLYKVQSKAYKFSFLLVPMSLPFLWLVFFWRRDTRLYDHSVFLLYSISFMSLLFIVGSLVVVSGLQLDFFWFLLVFVAPVTHMFFQLKGTYALSKRGAAWRTLWLGTAAIVTLGIYAALMIALGVLD